MPIPMSSLKPLTLGSWIRISCGNFAANLLCCLTVYWAPIKGALPPVSTRNQIKCTNHYGNRLWRFHLQDRVSAILLGNFYPEEGCYMFLRNVSYQLQYYMASRPRRPKSSFSPPGEPQISLYSFRDLTCCIVLLRIFGFKQDQD
jgi:hypothetical protein